MKLEELTLGELIEVGCAAEAACIYRLQAIAECADPSDAPLRKFLQRMVADVQACADDLEEFAAQRSREERSRLDESRIRAIIRDHFGSLLTRLGEGPLDRDIGLYLAELVERESAAFYRRVTELAPDLESREFFCKAAQGEESRLESMHTLLL